MDPKPILDAIVESLGSIAGKVPGVWGTVLGGIAAGVGLVGDLIHLGMNPQTEIHEIRSSVQSFNAAKERLEQKLHDKFPNG